MDNKLDLVIQALQERIGQLVSQYETHVAVLRAEITQLSDQIRAYEEKESSTKES
jgi:phage host-nuclease inhibitor protein Gam